MRFRNRSQHAFGVGQIEIPHPLPQFGIGQAVMLFRRRLNRLAEEMQLLGEDRQLARVRAAQLAVDADDDRPGRNCLASSQFCFADLLLADEQLNVARSSPGC